MSFIVPIGAVVNSALYITAVFVAALVAGQRLPQYLAIATFGATYFSYLIQGVVPKETGLCVAAVALSVVIGFFAGLSLVGGAL